MGIINLEQYEKEQDEALKQAQDELDKELEDTKKTSGEIPDKYRGKSLEEVIAIAENMEKRASRLGHEVGQLRQLRTQVELGTPTKKPEKKEVNVDALLENPEQAVETIVSQSSQVRELKDQVERISNDTAKREFEHNFPDYASDLQNDEFIEWALKNPVRRVLAQAADKYDFSAASELWSMWQERNELVAEANKQKAEQRKQEKDKRLKDGTLESGTGNSTETKKVFSRRDIRDIKTRALQGDPKAMDIVNDPEWNAQVMQAYVDKRAR